MTLQITNQPGMDCELAIRIRCSSLAHFRNEYLSQLARGSYFIGSTRQKTIGSHIQLVFVIEDHPGLEVWTWGLVEQVISADLAQALQQAPGMKLQLVDMLPERRKAIEGLFAQSELLSSSRRQPAPAPAAIPSPWEEEMTAAAYPAASSQGPSAPPIRPSSISAASYPAQVPHPSSAPRSATAPVSAPRSAAAPVSPPLPSAYPSSSLAPQSSASPRPAPRGPQPSSHQAPVAAPRAPTPPPSSHAPLRGVRPGGGGGGGGAGRGGVSPSAQGGRSHRLVEDDDEDFDLSRDPQTAETEYSQVNRSSEHVLTQTAQKLLQQIQGKDHYALLGISRDASAKEIREAYHHRTLEYHPDQFFRKIPEDIRLKIQTAFENITQAYQVLMDQDQRTEYDRKIGNYTNPAAMRASMSHVRSQENFQKNYKSLVEPRQQKVKQLLDDATKDIDKESYASALSKLKIALAMDPLNGQIKKTIDEIEPKAKPPPKKTPEKK